MVTALPFRGLRFDPTAVDGLGSVLAPPYDVLSREARAEFEAASPYNIVRLVLGSGAEDGARQYAEAAERLLDWQRRGVLRPEPAPAIYVYEEHYRLNGETQTQRGVLATVRLDDSGRFVVPHERTMRGPITDRLFLLEATRANLSPIFAAYRGGGRAIGLLASATADAPALDERDETGVRHRLWVVSESELVTRWSSAMADQGILIADGHHRYQTSIEYRDRMRAAHPDRADGPWEDILMYLVDADSHGPAILPIHRLLTTITADRLLGALAEAFAVTPLAGPSAIDPALEDADRAAIAFGVYGDGRTALAVSNARAGGALDVEVLHEVLRDLGVSEAEDAVRFQADLAAALTSVDQGDARCLVALRPVPFERITAIAASGRTVPQKTTFFYPKPRDGLVIRLLEAPQPMRSNA